MVHKILREMVHKIPQKVVHTIGVGNDEGNQCRKQYGKLVQKICVENQCGNSWEHLCGKISTENGDLHM